jgi:hypothetical protein
MGMDADAGKDERMLLRQRYRALTGHEVAPDCDELCDPFGPGSLNDGFAIVVEPWIVEMTVAVYQHGVNLIQKDYPI